MSALKSNEKLLNIDQSVTFLRIRALMKITITLLIVFGFLNTEMNSSDIFFTLASMIWLWQGTLEKIELWIYIQAVNGIKRTRHNKLSDHIRTME